jgi:hypothetical protein
MGNKVSQPLKLHTALLTAATGGDEDTVNAVLARRLKAAYAAQNWVGTLRLRALVSSALRPACPPPMGAALAVACDPGPT